MDKQEYLRQLKITFMNNEAARLLKYRAEKGAVPPANPADLARVSRTLFGPVDPEEHKRFLEEQLNYQNKVERDRWNFDFKKEEPVIPNEGGYKWVALTTQKKAVPIIAPKPRRPGQQKIYDYLPQKKCGENSEKKRKLIIESLKDGDQKLMHISH